MSNQLALAGAQPQKAPRFAPIFTSRFFSGIWTNRSPLRDATTSRLVEKWYGAAGDAMNAILAAAGHNLRIILRKLRFYWLRFMYDLLIVQRVARHPLAFE